MSASLLAASWAAIAATALIRAQDRRSPPAPHRERRRPVRPVRPVRVHRYIHRYVRWTKALGSDPRLDPHDLCHALELLMVSTAAGLDAVSALRLASGQLAPSLNSSLKAGLEAFDRGASIEHFLQLCFEPAGAYGQRSASAMADAIRDGGSITGALNRSADDVALEARRQAEREARRLPVQLLFPLVTCILPAFALLTVVPLLAGSLGSLPL